MWGKNWWAFLLAGLGVGYAVRWYEDGVKASESPDVPLPPLPQPPSLDQAVLEPDLPASYAEEWDEALARYSIDFYPPEAEPHLAQLLPPPSPDGVSVSVGCKVIAVGEDWWQLAGNYAQRFIDQGMSPPKVVREVLKYMAPSCVSNSTAAAEGIRLELTNWLSQATQRNGDPREVKT